MPKDKNTGIRIAADLTLPIAVVTLTQAVLGKKGGGKTYKASVQAEEMLERGQQIVVLDPTGAWWGLRAGADGVSVGYPVTIFGGKHADVPLEATAGEVLAAAIIADGFSAIIDLTAFTKSEEQRFCAAFLETLYRKNEKPLHLFLDEADVFAPQRPFGEEARTLGACQSIVRRGRIKGIGCTLITQRPQVLNKDVLSQVDMLTVLRMNHPKDIGAIDEWVAVHGDPKLAKEMIVSLPSLPKGDAWIWAPGDDLFKRVTYRDRRTFDSGRTPKAGEKVAQPRELAHVDLERLGEVIKATIERAKASDPKELRRRIAQLENEIATRESWESPESVALKARVAELERQPVVHQVSEQQLSDIIHAFGDFTRRTEDLLVAAKQMEAVDRNLGGLLRGRAPMVITSARVAHVSAGPRGDKVLELGVYTDHPPALERANFRGRPVPKDAGNAPPARVELKLPPTTIIGRSQPAPVHFPEGERKILSAIIQHGGVTREQLTVLVGYKKSSRDSYIKRLAAKGFVAQDNGGLVIATTAGLDAMPEVDPLPVGKALRDHWLRELPEGERVILEQLIRAYPAEVTRDELGESAGYKKSSRDSYIKRLGARALVASGRTGVRASDTLFGVV